MKQSLAKKLLTSCLVLSLVTFLSCGHQQKHDENGLFSDMGNSGDSSLSSDSSQFSEETLPSEGSAPSRSTSSAELEATLDSPAPTESSSDPLALPPMEDVAASTQSDLGTTTSEGPTTAALETTPSESPAMIMPTEGSSPAQEPAPLMADTSESAGIPSNIGSTETPAPEAAMTEAKPVATVAAVKTPEVPKESVWRKGQTLNRYYFLRNGDTAEQVAQMIYGNEAKAQELASLNPGKWMAGKIVLYVSPENAQDAEMQSFYEERGVSPEEYTVQVGDWLSKIATNTYGHAQSWKEIAAVNGMKDPNQLKVGMKISLYPAQMPVKAEKIAAVKMPENTNSEKVSAQSEVLPEVAAKPAMPEVAKVERTQVEKKKADMASPEIGGFFEQNFALVMTGLAFMMAMYFIRRRMRRSHELE